MGGVWRGKRRGQGSRSRAKGRGLRHNEVVVFLIRTVGHLQEKSQLKWDKPYFSYKNDYNSQRNYSTQTVPQNVDLSSNSSHLATKFGTSICNFKNTRPWKTPNRIQPKSWWMRKPFQKTGITFAGRMKFRTESNCLTLVHRYPTRGIISKQYNNYNNEASSTSKWWPSILGVGDGHFYDSSFSTEQMYSNIQKKSLHLPLYHTILT